MKPNTDPRISAKNRRFSRLAGCCLLIPIIVALILFAGYKANNLRPEVMIPGHEMPDDNARDYFLKAAVSARSIKHKSSYDIPITSTQTYTLADLKGCADDAEPALKLMREGLEHPFMAPAARTFDERFPWYAQFRELARVNAGAADYYAVTGDPGKAMQMHLDGLEMGVMLPHGDMLIGGLVGLSCETIAEARMEPLLPMLSSSELALAAARFDKIEAKRVPYADVIQEEGYMRTASYIGMLKDEKTSSNPYGGMVRLVADSDDDDTTPWGTRISHRITGAKFMMANKQTIMANNLEWFNELSREARQPYAGPSRVKVPNNTIARMTAAGFRGVRPRYGQVEAATTILRVEVALYRYRKDHGKYPVALNELTPAYLRSVPTDPCGGKPLHYALMGVGEQFLLYSIGPDLQDNHGVPAKNLANQPGEHTFDIVAGKLHEYKPILASDTQN